MAPFISVIIRLYNGIEFMEETITSVLNQTYEDWECIIGINGHGKNGNIIHRNILNILGKKYDPRIRVVNYPTAKGGAHTLNLLVKEATSQWVAILDADDKWEPTKLASQVNVINTVIPQPDIIGTRCLYFGEINSKPWLPEGFIDKDHFKTMNPLLHSSVLIRKELLEYRNIVFLHDYDLWCRLSIKDTVFFNIDEPLVKHRIHGKSFYNRKNKDSIVAIRALYFDGS